MLPVSTTAASSPPGSFGPSLFVPGADTLIRNGKADTWEDAEPDSWIPPRVGCGGVGNRARCPSRSLRWATGGGGRCAELRGRPPRHVHYLDSLPLRSLGATTEDEAAEARPLHDLPRCSRHLHPDP